MKERFLLGAATATHQVEGNMKLKRLNLYLDFIEAVQNCELDVYFISCEGDHLNLKSTLSLYLFASICGDRTFVEQCSVECKTEADYERLSAYLM